MNYCIAAMVVVAALLHTSHGGLVSVFETNDPGTATCGPCNTPSPLTGACSCPSGSAAPLNQAPLRVLNTNCATTDAFHGGRISPCSDERSPSAFGGVFQQDDQTLHSLGCRSPNAQTGACSCPAGTLHTQSFRVLVDTDTVRDFIGSTIVFCYFNISSAVNTGMYLADTVTSECLTGNPSAPSSGCSCPSSASSFSLVVVYPTASGTFRNATWVVCSNTAPTEICSGVTAVLDGMTDVTDAVMACINRTAEGGTLALPAGRYGIASQVAIGKAITLATADVALTDPRICAKDASVACVALVGLAACCSDGGIMDVFSPNVNINHINHIIIDGNRDARRFSNSWNECLNNEDNRGNAVNARINNVDNATFEYSASIQALCASGFQWMSDYCTIANSYFANNGNHADGRWSDGLTLLTCKNGHVRDLHFLDNTDVNLVCGCGAGFLVENIHIQHINAASFAGFMFDNFDNSQCGDYRGGVARNITVDCNNYQCDFGANFGPHPWYASSNILGGSVSYLTVSGAKQGVNCAGAGTTAAPLSLSHISVVGNVSFVNKFQCGWHLASDFNIDPDSVVDTFACPPNTSFVWKSCP